MSAESKTSQSEQAVQITAKDGFSLGGTLFSPEQPTGKPILLCPATGIEQRFYFRFARYLASQGHIVLTLDYRGIGKSLDTPHPKDSKVRKQDWGELDMPAALDWLTQHAASQQAVLIGHSAGAQLIGLMPNHQKVEHLIAIAATSGYVGKIGWPDNLFSALMVRCYLPLTARILGYAPGKRLGWGTDLPAGIATQWSSWCSRPGYVSNEFGKSIKQHYYYQLDLPVTLFRAVDDKLATPANIEDWLSLLPQIKPTIIELDHNLLGCKPMGHVGMFREINRPAWEVIGSYIPT